MPLVPERKAPERHGLVGALDNSCPYTGGATTFGIVTLLRYEDSSYSGGRGRSVNDPRRIMWLNADGNEFSLRRSSLFGYPDGAYDSVQIGQRFCISQHPRYAIEFDEHRRPVRVRESEERDTFLWSCAAAQRGEKLTSLDQLYR